MQYRPFSWLKINLTILSKNCKIFAPDGALDLGLVNVEMHKFSSLALLARIL